MSALELALRNLAAWSLQVAALAVAAAALSRLLPIERPAARLALGQALLLLVLGLPLVQPWRAADAAVSWSLELSPDAAPRMGAGATAAARGAAAPWPEVLAGLLLAGVAFRLARLDAGLARLRALRRSARALDAPSWLVALRDGLSPRARLLVSDEVGTPATFGLRRPVVLLPPAFAAMDREGQAAVALHELVHARRGDWAAILFEELLKAVLFFHPAVHWLVGRVRLAREQTVDAVAVRRLGGREAYLASLLAVARHAAHARAVPAAPFLRESHLRERVDLLLKEVLMSRLRTAAHVAFTAAAVVLAVAWAASALPLQSAAKPAAPAARPAAPTVPAAPPAPPATKAAVAEPKLVFQAKPAYPDDARKEGVQGLFRIDVLIGRDGTIREASVVVSAPTVERLEELEARKGSPAALEGDARLAAAALEAVRQWRYEPILVGGKPADFRATVTVNFRLS
jgi:beta-lactamase regulating signal transducer with metallopeptidase domain